MIIEIERKILKGRSRIMLTVTLGPVVLRRKMIESLKFDSINMGSPCIGFSFLGVILQRMRGE